MSQSATHVAEMVSRSEVLLRAVGVTMCHFTTAHTQLKSRSFHRECLPLAAMGMDIRYVAPVHTREHAPGVSLVPMTAHGSCLRRTFAAPSLLRELLGQDAGIYHFQDPELLPLGLLLKLAFRKRVIYDAYEDFPSMAANKPSIPRIFHPLAAGLVNAIEQLAARCLNGVMTADPFTLRRLSHAGTSKKLVFYNFPNLDFFPAPQARAKQFDVVYRGGLSERAGTFVLLDAMKMLAERRARPASLLLIGYPDDPAAGEKLRERIGAMGLESSTTIQGRIDHEQMAGALSQARIGVCPLQPIPKFLLNIPVKVFEYWACAMPVVATDLAPIRPFFPTARAGFLFTPGCVAELAGHIGWLLDHPEAALEMGRRGRRDVEQRFNNQCEIHKFQRFILRIAAKP